MKKLTFIFLLSLLVCSNLLAQVSIGIKAGGALSSHTSEDIGMGDGDFIKPTYLGGLFVNVPLASNLSVQSEVLYANKGYQSKVTPRGSFTPRYHLHYISIPIMLQYQVVNRLTVELGPELGYLLGTGSNINSSGFGSFSSEFPSFHEQLEASYRDLDIAVNIGVGYAFSDRWTLNLRYNMGLRDITDDFEVFFRSTNEPGSEVESTLYSFPRYNRSLQLSIGYRLF
ncbi:porin family protein [Tunicatimonas pelagia]|uniref:porin family protein n=1 Tax=Tunicatimonas pelagia TaxID=931531 RepID=UPI002664FB26|nr:porin family protein [Tunicatimonas pelagia]WKN44570.1 porin family protein [Tunicatimonas pelagia]